MPLLTRDDGTQFALQPYRELLPPTKASSLRSEIRNLAKNYGAHVCLTKLPDGQINAVFAPEGSVLLGETVWEHFDKPHDLIYCEALADASFVILVIVRGGKIYLDAKIPHNNVQNELFPLASGKNQYTIYVYGDVPISEQPENGKFSLNKVRLKSFTRLEQPLLPLLSVSQSSQLQPVETALRLQKFNQTSLLLLFLIAAALVILLGSGLYYLYPM